MVHHPCRLDSWLFLCFVDRDTSGLTCLHPAGEEGMRTASMSAEDWPVLWMPSERANVCSEMAGLVMEPHSGVNQWEDARAGPSPPIFLQ